MKTFLRILKSALIYPWSALSVFLLSILSTVLVLVPPLMTKQFLDVVIGEQKEELILETVLIAIGAIALRQFLVMGRTVLNTRFEQKVVHDLRAQLYDRIQRLPLPFFEKKSSGDLMSRVSTDVPAMEKVIIDSIDQGLSGVFQFLIILGFMFSQDVKLTLITLAPMPIVALITWLYSKYGSPRYTRSSEASAELNSVLHENLAGIKQIKAFTVEPEKLVEFAEKSKAVQKANNHVMRANAVTWPTVSLVAESGIVAMLGFGSYWLLNGQVESLGVIGAFLFAWGYLFEPISRLSPLGKTLTAGMVSAKRVFEVLDEPDEKNLSGGKHLDGFSSQIQFREVSFSYDPEGGQATLSKINLNVEKGQTVALVGATGSGKSTLIKVLSAFYEPNEGGVFIDGYPLSELNKEWWRDQIGYVTQESFLFNTTLRENLLLAKPHTSDAELWTILEKAQAKEFVSTLPEGLDTVTGERGTKLSGGQAQRISIARALLKNPAILLLDEATSAVDNKTERQIQEALEFLQEERTTFIIAHRLSTVRNADLIYVLDKGEIVEVGNHEELVQKEGVYRRLLAEIKTP